MAVTPILLLASKFFQKKYQVMNKPSPKHSKVLIYLKVLEVINIVKMIEHILKTLPKTLSECEIIVQETLNANSVYLQNHI